MHNVVFFVASKSFFSFDGEKKVKSIGRRGRRFWYRLVRTDGSSESYNFACL